MGHAKLACALGLAVPLLLADFDPAAIAKKTLPAVVTVKARLAGGDRAASGFIVDSSGTLVTNLHVIRGATALAVRTAGGEVYDDVRVRAVDERRDLAVLQVAAFGLPTVPLGDSDSLQPGQRVLVVGNPLGVLEGSVSTGVVSGVREMDGYKVVQTDASVNPGNSGGPMVDDGGRVIGVVTFKLVNAENLNFAVPINYVRGMLTGNDNLTLVELSIRLGRSADLFAGSSDSFPSRWKSLSSGNEKIIRIDGDFLYVETVLPTAQAQLGDFVIAQLKKDGDRYVGTTKSALTCGYTQGLGIYATQRNNTCRADYAIEITLFTPTRIEGRAPAPQPNAKFKCWDCTEKPAPTMQSFVWIPK
jgi:hypothetical protein